MWTPSRPSRPGEWFGSALAVVSLLVLAGSGSWGVQEWQGQKARDDARTAALIGCLEAAQFAADARDATNACLIEYADRVPALREDARYASVLGGGAAGEGSVLGGRSPSDTATWRPTLPLAQPTAAAAAVDDVVTEDTGEPAEPSGRQGGTPTQRVPSPVVRGEPPELRNPRAPRATDRPSPSRGTGGRNERPADAEPTRPTPRLPPSAGEPPSRPPREPSGRSSDGA